jgi:nitrite reductase (NADH) small subunit
MLVTVARVDDLPPGSVRHVRAGDVELALARVGDEFFATEGACLHLNGPLGHGELVGRVLSCPWHGWQYDVTTGLNEFDHEIELETYPVHIENGEVRVELPARP